MASTLSSNSVAGFASSTGFGSVGSDQPRRRTAVAFAFAFAAPSTRKGSLYEVLRVKETASAKEIKAAYRSLAKRFHPDVNEDPEAGSDLFLAIQGAYATLSDPAARDSYDRSTDQRLRIRPEPSFRRAQRWETDQCW